ncbi:MAG: hypothetical protein VE99_C0003G0033 [candidate division Kazan bacterium GW2011_GWC1_52_13]|nr:MAG: hypothetical protein VE99_C0003G0033 [candidate division Kazan bacterium GW2011_GWC1_52_13]
MKAIVSALLAALFYLGFFWIFGIELGLAVFLVSFLGLSFVWEFSSFLSET